MKVYAYIFTDDWEEIDADVFISLDDWNNPKRLREIAFEVFMPFETRNKEYFKDVLLEDDAPFVKDTIDREFTIEGMPVWAFER